MTTTKTTNMTTLKRYSFLPLLFLALWAVGTALTGTHNYWLGAIIGAALTAATAAWIGHRRKLRGW